MSQIMSITDRLKSLEQPFSKINGFNLDFKSELLFARQQIMKSDYNVSAAQNNPAALQNAILNVAAIGISLNPASKHAYLVPRSPGHKAPPQICLDISYLGLVKLATDAGAIEWAKAVLVYEGDTFTWRGPSEPPIHEADVFAADRIDAADPLKNLRGGYCLAKLTTGEIMVDVMTAGEILEVKATSKAKAGPWEGRWAGEMAKKTLVKRASKSWPQSSGRDRIDTAIQVLNQHEGIEEAESADEETVNKFMDLIASGNALNLLNFTHSLPDSVRDSCFNAAPRGEKTKMKDRYRTMINEANNVIDDYVQQITEMCEADDPAALDLYDELEGFERKCADDRISDITHRQLTQLRESVEIPA